MMTGSQASLVGFKWLNVASLGLPNFHQQVPLHILKQSSFKGELVLPICLPTSTEAGSSQGCQKVLKQRAALSK